MGFKVRSGRTELTPPPPYELQPYSYRRVVVNGGVRSEYAGTVSGTLPPITPLYFLPWDLVPGHNQVPVVAPGCPSGQRAQYYEYSLININAPAGPINLPYFQPPDLTTSPPPGGSEV